MGFRVRRRRRRQLGKREREKKVFFLYFRFLSSWDIGVGRRRRRKEGGGGARLPNSPQLFFSLSHFLKNERRVSGSHFFFLLRSFPIFPYFRKKKRRRRKGEKDERITLPLSEILFFYQSQIWEKTKKEWRKERVETKPSALKSPAKVTKRPLFLSTSGLFPSSSLNAKTDAQNKGSKKRYKS